MTHSPATCCQLAFTTLLAKHYGLGYFSALTCMHTLSYTHTHTHLCVPTCTHLHTHSPGSTCTHTCTHVCTHTLTQSPIHTMTTLTHTHTSTYTANHETGEKSLLRELPHNTQLCNDNRDLLPAAPNHNTCIALGCVLKAGSQQTHRSRTAAPDSGLTLWAMVESLLMAPPRQLPTCGLSN